MILIDGNHAMNRLVFMNLQNIKESQDFLSHLLLQQVISIAQQFGASKKNEVVIAVDSSSWRKEYYNTNKVQFKDLENETYKGNRTKSSDIPWSDIYATYSDICKVINQYSDFKSVQVDGAEADDIIAVLTKEKKQTEQVWIISSDKDFVQLQDEPRVSIYDPIKRQFKPKVDVEKYKKIHFIVAGDDNIKPVKARVGQKTAEKMLKDLDVILQTDPHFKARYEFNRNLIDFECIPQNVSQSILDVYNSLSFSYNQINLMKEFKRLNLVKMLENVSKFKLADTHQVTKLNSIHSSAVQLSTMQQSILDEFFD
jgi:5'-3' exonuclease